MGALNPPALARLAADAAAAAAAPVVLTGGREVPHGDTLLGAATGGVGSQTEGEGGRRGGGGEGDPTQECTVDTDGDLPAGASKRGASSGKVDTAPHSDGGAGCENNRAAMSNAVVREVPREEWVVQIAAAVGAGVAAVGWGAACDAVCDAVVGAAAGGGSAAAAGWKVRAGDGRSPRAAAAPTA
eukprot:gene10074-6955_t